jgi:ketosteroid isomerase-like protein
MTSLLEADAATRAEFVAWLERFSGYVREVDYASARPLFHPDILAFGTHRDIISGLASWQATQWDNVWPRTSDFRFDTNSARVLVSSDNTMATVIVTWTSTGHAQDGTPFDRPGRATMVFHKHDGAWLCTHSHMSLNRGVPQQSFANRPVKAK